MMGQIEIDHAALTLAIEAARNESPARRRQVDAMLADELWFDVGVFCAGCAQSRSSLKGAKPSDLPVQAPAWHVLWSGRPERGAAAGTLTLEEAAGWRSNLRNCRNC